SCSSVDELTVSSSCFPSQLFIAAVELTSVSGITVSPNVLFKTSHQISVCLISAISAKEHPALKSGNNTVCSWLVNISAVSGIQCTPQKTINCASSFLAHS